MASVRIHRQSCEQGRLPPVCICCGRAAAHRARHRFYFQRPRITKERFIPRIIGGVVAIAAVMGLDAFIFSRRQPSLWRDSVEFSVPLCNAHCRRLLWPDFFQYGLVAFFVVAAAALVSVGVPILRNQGDDVVDRVRTLETVLSASIALAAVLITMRMMLWLTTARVTNATPSFIDMAAVAPDFVLALRQTNKVTMPGYTGESMGVPLSSSAGLKQLGTVGVAMVVLVFGCGLVGYVGRASTIGKFKQHAGRIHAEAKTWQKKFTEVQQQLAEPERSTTEEKTSDDKDAEAEAATARTATAGTAEVAANEQAALENTPAAAESNPGEEAATSATADTQARASQRADEFKVFGRERFPPHSREIRDTTQLQSGMEVWASAGLTWYRSTVVRVEKRMIRIRFPASARLPERMLPVMQIRLPADGDGGAAQ